MASLQELPDDELDKLFRSSAEEFEPPYNPDDWNSLRRHLDDDDRLRFLDRFIYWGLPLLLLLLTITSLLVSPNGGSIPTQTAAKRPGPVQEIRETATRRRDSPNGLASTEPKRAEPSPAVTNGSKPSSAATSQPTDRDAEPDEAGAVPKNTGGKKPSLLAGTTARSAPEIAVNRARSKPSASELNPSSTPETITPGTAPRSRLNASGNPKDNPTTGRTVTARAGSRSVDAGGRRTPAITERANRVQNRTRRPESTSTGRADARDEQTTAMVYAGSEPSKANATDSEPFDLRGNLAYIPARARQPSALPALPELNLEPVRPPVVPKMTPSVVPVVGYPALSIRIVAAPDLNFVGRSDKGARDFQVGVLAEYRFLRRFTAQAGVLRSVKKYRAAASDYTRPDHWYGPMYESVDAVCTVLDIPVNLRFDFLLNDRRRWFVSSGVSSYIMQEENYKYNYPYGVNPTQPKYKEWYGKTGFHEWSHLNFSFGYERNFSSDGPLRRLSWQVEPFLKNPRRSTLGYGKIRLMSTGVFFSLRYRL